MSTTDENFIAMQIKIAVLEEREKEADKALKLAADYLEAWKHSANEWRSALNDQRSTFITRAEVITYILIGLTLLGLALKFIK